MPTHPPSDSEPEYHSEISLSDPSQHFEPRDDDDETLYEVIEITAEKGKKYKVRWKGNDPKTMKPWPQSWVAKTDCTDDLVRKWKRVKKEKGAKSTSSKRASRTSIASTARSRSGTSKANGRSHSLATSTTTVKREPSIASARTATPSHIHNQAKVASKGKGKAKATSSKLRDAHSDLESEDEDEGEDWDADAHPAQPRISSTKSSTSTKPNPKPKSKSNSNGPSSSTNNHPRGTKRKLIDALSATSSANAGHLKGRTVDVEIEPYNSDSWEGEDWVEEADDDEEAKKSRVVKTKATHNGKDNQNVVISDRPTKKRRVAHEPDEDQEKEDAEEMPIDELAHDDDDFEQHIPDAHDASQDSSRRPKNPKDSQKSYDPRPGGSGKKVFSSQDHSQSQSQSQSNPRSHHPPLDPDRDGDSMHGGGGGDEDFMAGSAEPELHELNAYSYLEPEPYRPPRRAPPTPRRQATPRRRQPLFVPDPDDDDDADADPYKDEDEDEDEEEERMVEDALSEAYASTSRDASPSRDASAKADGNGKGKGKGKARTTLPSLVEEASDEEDEDEEEVEIVSVKIGPPRKSGLPTPRPLTRTKLETNISIAHAKSAGPPTAAAAAADAKPTRSESKSKSKSKSEHTKADDGSGVDSGSETDRPPPALIWERETPEAEQTATAATAETTKGNGKGKGKERAEAGVEDRERLPPPKRRLSRGAIRRLEVFDVEVMGKKPAPAAAAKANGKANGNGKAKAKLKNGTKSVPVPASKPGASVPSTSKVPGGAKGVNGTTVTTTTTATKTAATAETAEAAPVQPARRATTRKASESYLTDEVPDSVEASQSQEEELVIPREGMDVNAQVDTDTKARGSVEGEASSTPQSRTKDSIKARMKPRTPLSRTSTSHVLVEPAEYGLGSRSGSGSGGGPKPTTTTTTGVPAHIAALPTNLALLPASLAQLTNVAAHPAHPAKPHLRPIPQLSPSAFQAHLPSSLPESIIVDLSSSNDREKRREEEAETDGIEEFESPEKSKDGVRKLVGALARGGGRSSADRDIDILRARERESAEDVWESEVVRQGRKMAADAERRRRESESANANGNGNGNAGLMMMSSDGSGAEDDGAGGPRRRLEDVVQRASARIGSWGADGQEEEEEEGVADASTMVLPPASGPPALSQSQSQSQSQEQTNSQLSQPGASSQPQSHSHSQSQFDPQSQLQVQQLEAAYVDLSGGMDQDPDPDTGMDVDVDVDQDPNDNDNDNDATHPESSPPAGPAQALDPMLLRREEEESTQDLMLEMQMHQDAQRGMQDLDVDAGWDLGPAAPPPAAAAVPPASTSEQAVPVPEIQVVPPPPVSNHGDDRNESDVYMDVPKITVQKPSRAPSVRSRSQSVVSEASPPPQRMTRARSRSQTPSSTVESSKPKKNGRGKKGKPLDIPSPIQSREGSPEVEGEKPQSKADIFENPKGASSSTASILAAQISTLESHLEAERLKNQTLHLELESLRKQHQLQRTQTESEHTSRLADAQTEWAAEKSLLEASRDQWQSVADASAKGKLLAEKDRDFFREQYAQASGFVSSIRDENKDLEKRVQIAESQTQAGLELVRATFEKRVKVLEDDLKLWRRMAEFALEKDTRTNDVIRRRAAEEPELRARCAKQSETIFDLQSRIEDLEAEGDEKDGKLAVAAGQLEHYREENVRLHWEWNEARVKLDRVGRMGAGEDSGDSQEEEGNGHEFVYRCRWRGGQQVCEEVFLTMRDLERHLFTGNHLEHPQI